MNIHKILTFEINEKNESLEIHTDKKRTRKINNIS